MAAEVAVLKGLSGSLRLTFTCDKGNDPLRLITGALSCAFYRGAQGPRIGIDYDSTEMSSREIVSHVLISLR